MGPDSRLDELLSRWEELRGRGQPVSAEDLCRDCPELLEAVRWHVQALESGGPPTTDMAPKASGPARPTVAIPGYEVLEELGHGGMGVVYKARQVKANRLVALKMILTSRHASVAQRVRFQIEAEAIARLQHPNIVQLYEVGECDGLPFFSLEFCAGGSLAQQLKGSPLSGREAAQLVEVLARAMHYAHLRGVLHRDLKPANILLEAHGLPPVGFGTPKIGDFGLAKQLGAGSDVSQSGTVLGTPSYMAPEQAAGRGREVGPAADVYALGVILYELLTGRTPFRGATPLETLHEVLTAEPAPPSRLRGGVPCDLETVCLKCLRKDPGHRYPSAEELAEDLRRFLAGEPIRARQVGAAERAVKWARRNPLAAGLSAAVVVVAAVGFGLVTWMWREAVASAAEATRAKDRAVAALTAEAHAKRKEAEHRADAERRRTLALRLVDMTRRIVDVSSVEVSRSPALKAAGLAPLRQALLQMPVKFYQEYTSLRHDDPDFLAEEGKVLRRLGSLQEETGAAADALASYEKAIGVLTKLAREHPREPAYRRELAVAHNDLALLNQRLRRFEAAGQGYRASLALNEQLVRDDPAAKDCQDSLAACLHNLGSLYAELGQEEKADAAYRRSRALWEDLARAHPDDPGFTDSVATSHSNLGLRRHRKGQLQEAENAMRKAGELWGRLVQASPRVAKYWVRLAGNQNNLAKLLRQLGRPAEARAAFTRAIDLCQALVGAHPAVPEYWGLLAYGREGRGYLFWKEGREEEGRADYRAAIEIWEGLNQTSPPPGEYTRLLARANREVGEFDLRAGRAAVAEVSLVRWLELEEKLQRANPADPSQAEALARACCHMGHLQRNADRPLPSLPHYDRGIAVAEAQWTKEKSERLGETLSMAHWGRALSLARLGRHAEAMPNWDRALEFQSRGDRKQMRLGRAETLARLGRHADAAREAASLAQLKGSGEFHYGVARLLALACGAARADATLPAEARARSAAGHATGAVAALERARAAGFFAIAANRERLWADPDLGALRGHDGFQQFSAGGPQ